MNDSLFTIQAASDRRSYLLVPNKQIDVFDNFSSAHSAELYCFVNVTRKNRNNLHGIQQYSFEFWFRIDGQKYRLLTTTEQKEILSELCATHSREVAERFEKGCYTVNEGESSQGMAALKLCRAVQEAFTQLIEQRVFDLAEF